MQPTHCCQPDGAEREKKKKNAQRQERKGAALSEIFTRLVDRVNIADIASESTDRLELSVSVIELCWNRLAETGSGHDESGHEVNGWLGG